ncbi:MAG: alpha/beta hydrolase family protein [Agriterribacter sp.]
MKSRRKFLKIAGITGLSTGSILKSFSAISVNILNAANNNTMLPGENLVSLIGNYGQWASGLTEKQLPAFSFRNSKWTDINKWRIAAKKQLAERLAAPEIKAPAYKTIKVYEYDGLQIEELQWQLPYGRATSALLLKPVNAKAKLPAILAFHDHGGNKYFGVRKITKTSDVQHPLMTAHQKEYYEGLAWANEIAKRGYVVLVADAFPFASRRVMLQDVPLHLRNGLTDDEPERSESIHAYNKWAAEHEHIMAKSLFSAGTTWPGVFFAEDRVALDVLCARADVDNERVGCCGLSGGGMRTVFMGGLEERIKCAVCVGFMTTWKDFVLNKSYTHTWMTYVPLLPNELDFPEILGLRAPLPTLVLNDIDDELYTLPEMKQADHILQQVFKKTGAAGKYKCSFYEGPHKFDRSMQKEAFDWFDKWLK